jgi:PTS system mannitol-specific IIC component
METQTSDNNSGALRTAVQKLGTNLSSMIMPNIGMFIAWGLITALFIETGWLPNPQLAELNEPMLNYLLPIMIGYQGGKLVYEERGGVVGAIATMGVIVGSEIPMFIGAMIMGPLAGWVIKKFDGLFQNKIRAGFEMLYNNFSAGILGALLAILGYYAVGPAVTAGTNLMAQGVDYIIQVGVLPLANIFIEPAKVLFLNNAINHGILTPLGTEQSLETGKSILYLLEANPGPGLGILLGYMMYGKGSAKSSSSGALIIHFLGGIHEIYFPYIMMKPSLFLAVIGGGVSGTFVSQLLGAGLSAPASPGSIFAVMAMTPRGEWLQVLAGVAVAALVSFIIAAIILRADKSAPEENDLNSEIEKSQSMKQESKGTPAQTTDEIEPNQIDKVIFACDAGMGSSAMGASLLRKKFEEEDIDMDVTNSAINQLKDDANTLVITQQELTNRAQQRTPSSMHISVDNFLQSPKYDDIVAKFSSGNVEEEETQEPEQTTDRVENIEKINVVYDDSTRGSGTMLLEMLREDAEQMENEVTIEKIHKDEMIDEENTVFVVPEKLSKQVDASNVEIVKNKINEKEISEIIAKY